jgi:membrane protease YdiL (CAAX protease family)
MPFRPPFEAFVAPARARPALWRLILGAVTVLLVYLLWVALMAAAMWLLAGRLEMMLWIGRVSVAVDPWPMLVLLLTFGGLALGAVAAARIWHRRGAGTLLGRTPVVLRDFVRAALVAWVVYGILSLPLALSGGVVANLALSRWLVLLPLGLAGIALQTLAEELVFRGYLMQQLAARFRSLWLAMLVPSLIFGALHWNPLPGGPSPWLLVGWAAAFGLVAADLTRRTGSLGAAWGLHFANNCVAILVVSTGGMLPGLALYVTDWRASDPRMMLALASDAVAMLVVWLLLVRLLRR